MVDPGFNPSTTVLPGAPTNLIAFDYGGYAGTAVDSGTVWSLGTTAITYPSPASTSQVAPGQPTSTQPSTGIYEESSTNAGNPATPQPSSDNNAGPTVVTIGSQGYTVAPAAESGGSSANVITVGSQPFTVSPVATSAIAAVSSPAVITVGSQTYALAPAAASGVTVGSVSSAVVTIGSQVITVAPAAAPQATSGTAAVNAGQLIVSVGSQQLTVTPAAGTDAIVLASQTLSVGGPGITVGGQTLSLGSGSQLVVVSSAVTSTQTLPSAATAGVVIGSQTLYQGAAPFTTNGQTLSLGAGNVLVAASGSMTVTQTLDLGARPSSEASPGIVIPCQTLYPGGTAITVGGSTLSLAQGGTQIVAVSGTVTRTENIGSVSTPAAANAGIVVGSQTLQPGSTVVVNGETLSLASSGSDILVISGTKTSTAHFAVGAGSESAVVIASQTLYPGGSVITVNRETLSLAKSGGSIVVGSGTVTSTEGLGGYILSGLGQVGSATATRTGGSAAATGGSSGGNGLIESGSGTASASQSAPMTVTTNTASRKPELIGSTWASIMAVVFIGYIGVAILL
ncbi:hypothetical protein M8818_005115 [Zalaria obscura]|uniref:Uncharacterized protein n=1 Tax=Zalaria obscura TaxID=2024903 RepID=A0ACC3SBL6_9PEZI